MGKLRVVWQLLGLPILGLLFFCSTSLKFASWPKMAAEALGIMSAFQASGRRKGQRAPLLSGSTVISFNSEGR